MQPIPSDEEIRRIIAANQHVLGSRELAYLKKLADLIHFQSRNIHAHKYSMKARNIHESADAIVGFYWARFRRRLNWIDFMRHIKKARRRVAVQLMQSGTFTRGKSRLPKKRRKNK